MALVSAACGENDGNDGAGRGVGGGYNRGDRAPP